MFKCECVELKYEYICKVHINKTERKRGNCIEEQHHSQTKKNIKLPKSCIYVEKYC